MDDYKQRLNKWAEKVDSLLPNICPECQSELDQIRYTQECSRMSIQLTGAIIDTHYYIAECPYCNHVLKKECISSNNPFVKVEEK